MFHKHEIFYEEQIASKKLNKSYQGSFAIMLGELFWSGPLIVDNLYVGIF